MAVTAAWARGDRRASLLAPAVALLLACAVVLVARWGPDWPAQEFRAWQFAHDGLTAWTSRWYGGEALIGYSLLYPILAGAFGAGAVGVAAVGVAAVVTAAWAAAGFAPVGRLRARCYAVAVAFCLMQSLLIGQIPYLLGVAFGLLALRIAFANDMAPGAGRSTATAFCSVLCSLASPLAGASLMLAVPAVAIAHGWRRAAPMSASLIGVGVSAVLGGASGPFPFQVQSLFGVVAFCVLILALAERDARTLRWFALCYLVAAVALFLLANPIGGNAARVGKLIALPLAVRFMPLPRTALRRAVAALAIVAAAVWPSLAFMSSIARGAADPSQQPAYYQGLLHFLRTQDAATGRLEIPMLREHWEALWVARAYPIARGWERQSDILYNAALYRPLSPAGYHRWLADNAVTLVALPNAPIDYGGRSEQRLLARPPGYLQPVWHDRHWRVWRVVGTRPFVSGAATITAASPASLALYFARAGTAVIRIHASPLWHVTGGDGCAGSDSDGWLTARAVRSGPLDLEAEVNSQVMTGADPCPG
jgi:hypothetical protein